MSAVLGPLGRRPEPSTEIDVVEVAPATSLGRQMLTIGLFVLAVDWAAKAVVMALAPDRSVAHYTHPNPLALLLVLGIAPIVLRGVPHRGMAIVLGICIGGCAGNLFQYLAGIPVTDFIPVPHLLINPTCARGYGCTYMCNLADIALWSSVPLMALAFVAHVWNSRRLDESSVAPV